MIGGADAVGQGEASGEGGVIVGVAAAVIVVAMLCATTAEGVGVILHATTNNALDAFRRQMTVDLAVVAYKGSLNVMRLARRRTRRLMLTFRATDEPTAAAYKRFTTAALSSMRDALSAHVALCGGRTSEEPETARGITHVLQVADNHYNAGNGYPAPDHQVVLAAFSDARSHIVAGLCADMQLVAGPIFAERLLGSPCASNAAAPN